MPPNLVHLTHTATRCVECRHSGDCPVAAVQRANEGDLPAVQVRVLHAGDHPYRAGDRVEAMYRLRSGAIKTSLIDSEGNEQVTDFVSAGEWLGLDAMDREQHRSDATVLSTASVCVIPHNLVYHALAQSSDGAQLLLGMMSRQVARKENLHLSLAQDTAAQRMAAFLLDASERQVAAGLHADAIALPMTRGEIASYLALAVETVSRLLTRMQRAGIIRVFRHQVDVINRQALLELCERSSAPQALDTRHAAVS